MCVSLTNRKILDFTFLRNQLLAIKQSHVDVHHLQNFTAVDDVDSV